MSSRLFYALTTVFIRLSIAVFLIRICLKRAYKIIIYATMVMVTSFSIFYFFLVLFQCSPVSFFWNGKPPQSIRHPRSEP
jgi:hypothetical protein